MKDEFAPDLLTLTDEDGKELEFEILDLIETEVVFDSDGPDCSAPSPKALETSRSREKISLFRSRRFRSVLIRLP